MSDLDRSTSNSLEKRYAVILIVIPLMNSQKSPALGGHVDHPNAKGINSQRMNGKKMKSLKRLWKMNLLRLRSVHRWSKYGKKRWHHHQNHHHKRCNHQDLYLWDWLMDLENKGLHQSSLVWRTQNSKSLSGGKIGSYPYLLFRIAWIIFTLAYLLFCICIALRKKIIVTL